MSSRQQRKAYLFGSVAVLSILFIVANSAVFVSLRNAQFFSGWVLLGLTVLLAVYNLRKKLPFLPLGSASVWLQLHLGAGWIALIVFSHHLHLRFPHGTFETLLALVFVLVAFSGIAGLFLSKFLPSRLATRGKEVLFERIPESFLGVRREAERLALQSISETDSTAIADFYVERLKPFFEGPKHFWRHLFQSRRPRQDLLAEMEFQQQYLNEKERTTFEEIAHLVRVKDDLDYHYALQASLKYWLLIHVPLTYCLLILSALHVALVYAFAGGLP